MEKLLFTGASGFLGSNILPLLKEHYKVVTAGPKEQDDILIDLSKSVPILKESYDVILHAAGKAHIVPNTPEEIQSFYDVNYGGTVNLCAGLEKVGVPKSFIFISTLSVYGIDNGDNVTEEFPLKGESPYAKSKIMAEEYLQTWCKKHNVILTIFRPSLLAGKNAPGNLKAMIHGIKTGAYLSIAGGKAHKSMLMASDIARLIVLAENKGGTYNICDSHHPTFGELEISISKQLGKRKPLSIPYCLAKCIALFGDLIGPKFPLNSARLVKIVSSDTYSNEKAKRILAWEPLDVISNYQI